MQTDVKAAALNIASTTTVTSYRTRIKAVALTTTAAAGALTITDGSGGATLFAYTPGAAAGSMYMLFPGEGILALTGIYVTTGTGTGGTVIYG